MATSESLKKAIGRYKEKNIKRIPLDVQKEYYNKIKETAEKYGYSVNGFIKEAIQEKIEKLH